MQTAIDRVTLHNDSPINESGEYVLYWMIASRRLRYNYGLDRAVAWAKKLNKPLVILEAIRLDYRWACSRFHQFIVDGMRDNASDSDDAPVTYYPYVERKPGEGAGLLEALAKHACAVVTDTFPCFFLPAMVTAAGEKISVRLEAVDSNGLLPLNSTTTFWKRAVDLRRHLQKNLLLHLNSPPDKTPLTDLVLPSTFNLPSEITSCWPAVERSALASLQLVKTLPINQKIAPVEDRCGGARQAEVHLNDFIEHNLSRYINGTKDVLNPATSGLSPYLHFGHISTHEVFDRIVDKEGWSQAKVSQETPRGKREGWWGMSPEAESFLDELITWRELSSIYCWHNGTEERYEDLPAWAVKTLDEHRSDPRPYVYSLEQFRDAKTHDPLWNAAQNELRQTGMIHSYIRMLWGKKILHWSATPEDALEIMFELNNAYALDGRDPNSHSGIMWCLGRHDRAWGPERPIFGKIRYMTSRSTSSKLRVKSYIARYS